MKSNQKILSLGACTPNVVFRGVEDSPSKTEEPDPARAGFSPPLTSVIITMQSLKEEGKGIDVTVHFREKAEEIKLEKSD